MNKNKEMILLDHKKMHAKKDFVTNANTGLACQSCTQPLKIRKKSCQSSQNKAKQTKQSKTQKKNPSR